MTTIEIDDQFFVCTRFDETDIPAMIQYLNNPKIIANTLRIPSPYTQEHGEQFVQAMRSKPSDLSLFFTIRSTSRNEMIGACGLLRSPETEHRAEIGYWLAEPFWNRGLMPKVVLKVIEHARQQWTNLVRLEAEIFPWNRASMRVVEKCGMTLEGVLRKYHRKNNELTDIHLYALIFD